MSSRSPRKAEVEHLVLFHHDPYHKDTELEALVADARRIWGDGDDRVWSAWEGMTMALDASGISLDPAPVS